MKVNDKRIVDKPGVVGTPLSEKFGAPAIMTEWCNIFGGEWDGGAKRVLGGLGPQTPSKQWYCPTPSIGHFRMRCEHGHQGQIMHLCQSHLDQFKDAVTFCPACNNSNDANKPGHKCKLTISEVS